MRVNRATWRRLTRVPGPSMIVSLPGGFYETGDADFRLCPSVRHQCRACARISWLHGSRGWCGNVDAAGSGRRTKRSSSSGVGCSLRSDCTTGTDRSGFCSATADPGAAGLPKPELFIDSATAGPIASRLPKSDLFVAACRNPKSSRKRQLRVAAVF